MEDCTKKSLGGVQRDDSKGSTRICNWALQSQFHSYMHRYSSLLPAKEISEEIKFGARNQSRADRVCTNSRHLTPKFLEYSTTHVLKSLASETP